MKARIMEYLQTEITSGSLPGCVISISHKGETVLREALGNRMVDPHPAKVEVDTMFDLASLTKVVATLPAILKLMDQGKISLQDCVCTYIPAFSAFGKESITVEHLLTHTAGLPAHRQFYAENLSTEQIIERINQEALVASPGTKVIYSDLGFIILYHLIEKITGERFDIYVEREIFQPLEMTMTGFNPEYPSNRFAATEYNELLEDYKCGVVHDDNTEAMNGVSGHAGLFSTIEDLEKYARLIENNGVYQGKRILSRPAIAISRQSYTPFDLDQRGLGWMLKSPKSVSTGDYFSAETYGHTGFTGTSIWFDPRIDLHVIFLTNSVHFGRENVITGLRAKLHNLILAHHEGSK